MSKFIEAFPHLQMRKETYAEVNRLFPQYLMYRTIRGNRKYCQCSACGQSGEFELYEKHGDQLECPVCRATVKMAATGKYTSTASTLWAEERIAYFQRHGDDVWAVAADARRAMYRDSLGQWSVSLQIYPIRVYQFAQDHAACWKSDWYGNWSKNGRVTEPPTKMYQTSEYYVFQVVDLWDSHLQYFAQAIQRQCYINEGSCQNHLMVAFGAYCKRHTLELVVKWGLDEVWEDLIWNHRTNGRLVNWRATTPWEFLKISKADWSLYRQNSGACVQLLKDNRKVYGLLLRELLKLVPENEDYSRWRELAIQLEEYGYPLKAQLKYLGRQPGNSLPHKMRLWRDYLAMAKECGREVSPAGGGLPRDLRQAHDDMVELRRAMRAESEARALEEKHKAYAKRREKLEKKYSYSSQGLQIRVPSGAREIVDEGNILHICVGGYAARHMEGKTTILFLRRVRKPDTPFVCIEIDEKDNHIVQIHGYRNEHYGFQKHGRSPGITYEKFLKEWLAWVAHGSRRSKNTGKEVTA